MKDWCVLVICSKAPALVLMWCDWSVGGQRVSCTWGTVPSLCVLYLAGDSGTGWRGILEPENPAGTQMRFSSRSRAG